MNLRKTQEFVSLLTDHQEVLRSYIISQIPGCSEVRDILQEVNILLWEKIDSFKIGTNFGAWACTVAYYKGLDYLCGIYGSQVKNYYLDKNGCMC